MTKHPRQQRLPVPEKIANFSNQTEFSLSRQEINQELADLQNQSGFSFETLHKFGNIDPKLVDEQNRSFHFMLQLIYETVMAALERAENDTASKYAGNNDPLTPLTKIYWVARDT